MAYSCWAALSATYRTLSRSLPKGRCGPCFSMMPNGSRQVPCARPMASRNSAAVSSSQWTETLLCGEGDCAHTSEAQSALMESTSVLGKGSSSKGGPRALMLLARGDSCQVHPPARKDTSINSCRPGSGRWFHHRWVGAFDHEPQHDRQLPEQGGLGEQEDLVLVCREEYPREAQQHVGRTIDEQPHADEPRHEARPVCQGTHREEPQPPQDLRGRDLMVMQLEE